jgi:hypothetical protein
MTPEQLQFLIPIVAILAVFGLPVALVFVFKYFKLKDRELQLEADAQRWVREQHQLLEGRVQRLESVVLSLDQELRARLATSEPPELPERASPTNEGAAAPPSRTPQR